MNMRCDTMAQHAPRRVLDDEDVRVCAVCRKPMNGTNGVILRCIHRMMHIDCNPSNHCFDPIIPYDEQCPLCYCYACKKKITSNLFKKPCGCQIHEECRAPYTEIMCSTCGKRVEVIIPPRKSPQTFMSHMSDMLHSAMGRTRFTSDYITGKTLDELVREGLCYYDILTSDCAMTHFVKLGLRWVDLINLGLNASNFCRRENDRGFEMTVLVDQWQLTGDKIMSDLMMHADRFIAQLKPSILELEQLKVTLSVLVYHGLTKSTFLKLPYTSREIITSLHASVSDFTNIGIKLHDCLKLIRERGWTREDFSHIAGYKTSPALQAMVESAFKELATLEAQAAQKPPQSKSSLSSLFSTMWSSSSASSSSSTATKPPAPNNTSLSHPMAAPSRHPPGSFLSTSAYYQSGMTAYPAIHHPLREFSGVRAANPEENIQKRFG